MTTFYGGNFDHYITNFRQIYQSTILIIPENAENVHTLFKCVRELGSKLHIFSHVWYPVSCLIFDHPALGHLASILCNAGYLLLFITQSQLMFFNEFAGLKFLSFCNIYLFPVSFAGWMFNTHFAWPPSRPV